MKGLSARGTKITFGEFGFKALEGSWVSSRQIEASRRVLTRYTQKGGRVWIRIFPDKPISDKPPEVRMGGGKGDIVDYVAVVRPGRVIFEMGGVPEELAKVAMKMAGSKLPIKTQFLKKQ